MKKIILGVVMVVVFCIAWWLVVSEAKKAIPQVEKTLEQAKQAVEQAKQAVEQAKQAVEQVSQAVATAQKWGIGAGLLADVLLLVGALAWSKLTAKA